MFVEKKDNPKKAEYPDSPRKSSDKPEKSTSTDPSQEPGARAWVAGTNEPLRANKDIEREDDSKGENYETN